MVEIDEQTGTVEISDGKGGVAKLTPLQAYMLTDELHQHQEMLYAMVHEHGEEIIHQVGEDGPPFAHEVQKL